MLRSPGQCHSLTGARRHLGLSQDTHRAAPQFETGLLRRPAQSDGAGTEDVKALGPSALDLLAASQSAGWGIPPALSDDRACAGGGGGRCRNSLLEPLSPDGWLNAMADRFPNGSINIFDREMRYVFAEGEGLRAVGLSAGALVGKRLADIFSAESVAYVEPFYRRAFQGESVRFELPIVDRMYYIAAGPMTTENGSVTRIIAVTKTSRTRRHQRRAAHGNRPLGASRIRANRVRDELLSVVSHELERRSTPSSGGRNSS